MSATYSVRGKGSADYARKTWMPEPPPQPKPRQYIILGMEVDYNTYREYMYEREYRIDGDVLKDFSTNLWTLERYATEEHEKEFPIEAANARTILGQIREEIIATMKRKEEKDMKDPRTAADFIAALQDIYNESRAVYDSINANMEKAREKMDRAQEAAKEARGADAVVANAKYEIARGEYFLANGEARPAYKRMMNEHDAKVTALREQFAAFLDDHYAASPDKLDSATMQLLNSGICTPSELSRLIDRHKDNPTMLRIVGNYARNMREEKKRTLTYDDRLICTQVAGAAHAAKDGSRELAIFDSAVSSLAYGLSDDYGHASRMHNYVATWAEDFKNQISNLPLTPAEQSEPSGPVD